MVVNAAQLATYSQSKQLLLSTGVITMIIIVLMLLSLLYSLLC